MTSAQRKLIALTVAGTIVVLVGIGTSPLKAFFVGLSHPVRQTLFMASLMVATVSFLCALAVLFDHKQSNRLVPFVILFVVGFGAFWLALHLMLMSPYS